MQTTLDFTPTVRSPGGGAGLGQGGTRVVRTQISGGGGRANTADSQRHENDNELSQSRFELHMVLG